MKRNKASYCLMKRRDYLNLTRKTGCLRMRMMTTRDYCYWMMSLDCCCLSWKRVSYWRMMMIMMMKTKRMKVRMKMMKLKTMSCCLIANYWKMNWTVSWMSY